MVCPTCGGPKVITTKYQECEICGGKAEYCDKCFNKNRDEGYESGKDSRNDEVTDLQAKVDELTDKLSKIYNFADDIDTLADKITDEAIT